MHNNEQKTDTECIEVAHKPDQAARIARITELCDRAGLGTVEVEISRGSGAWSIHWRTLDGEPRRMWAPNYWSLAARLETGTRVASAAVGENLARMLRRQG